MYKYIIKGMYKKHTIWRPSAHLFTEKSEYIKNRIILKAIF